MKILICGANGAVGKDLVYFLSKKHKILATYRNNKKNGSLCEFRNGRHDTIYNNKYEKDDV